MAINARNLLTFGLTVSLPKLRLVGHEFFERSLIHNGCLTPPAYTGACSDESLVFREYMVGGGRSIGSLQHSGSVVPTCVLPDCAAVVSLSSK